MAECAGLSSVIDEPGEAPGPIPVLRPESPVRYMAFISYSHRDEAVAEWLQDSLEEFVVPPALVGQPTDQGPVPSKLSPIFRDREDLAAAGDLGTEIREALTASRFLIVLCSPHAAQSRWANEEIEAFRRLRPDGEILPAIVSGEPFASDLPGREKEECFPPALRLHYDASGRPTGKRAEPIAADFRKSGDGRRIGFLKVAAGMLGVGLDQLVQRETLRRQRRLAIVAAASLAGMAVTSTLAIVAIQSRDEARDQRREAEGLIGFMLGDLRSTLEPIGRLDALDAVGSRALEYFQKQDKGTLSDQALTQRSKALTLLGEIANSRGDLDGALRRYRESMAGTAEALRRAPDDPQRMYEHAQNVFWVGEIARQRGNMDGAETANRQYKQLADRMVAMEPANRKWRMEAQYAATNLGIVLFERGRYSEASEEFQRALASIEPMAAAEPQNMEFQKSYLQILAWLADAQFGEGRLDEAIAKRERQIVIIDGLVRANPGDVEYRRRAIPARRALGRWLASRGEIGPGLDQARAAVQIGQKLIPAEPDNMVWVEMTAGAQLDLAAILLAARKAPEAALQTKAACDLADRLVARDRTVVEWRSLAVACLGQRARLALADGRRDEALAFAERILASSKANGTGNAIDDQIAVARSYKLVGDILRRMGDRTAAQAAWSAALAAWPKTLNENPREMAVHAELLKSLGRAAEARPMTDQLNAMGYRVMI